MSTGKTHTADCVAYNSFCVCDPDDVKRPRVGGSWHAEPWMDQPAIIRGMGAHIDRIESALGVARQRLESWQAGHLSAESALAHICGALGVPVCSVCRGKGYTDECECEYVHSCKVCTAGREFEKRGALKNQNAPSVKDQAVLAAMSGISEAKLRCWVSRRFETVVPLAEAELARRGLT